MSEMHREYYRADSVDDASTRLAESDGETYLIAGGQTLMLHLRQGLKNPSLLIDISNIDELRRVTDDEETVRIGSASTYAEIANNETVRTEFPYLAEAVGEIAGPQVRNNGTIGGGLCYGDPALDSPAVLLTLDADVHILGPDGTRVVPLDEFYTGFYETDIDSDEILTDVSIPKLPTKSAGTYRTMTPRQGDYAISGVSVRLSFDDGTCEIARIGLTNAGDRPKRARTVEAQLEGTSIDEATLESAVAALSDELDLIGDEQIPRSYQETVFKRLTKQSIRETAETIRGDTDD